MLQKKSNFINLYNLIHFEHTFQGGRKEICVYGRLPVTSTGCTCSPGPARTQPWCVRLLSARRSSPRGVTTDSEAPVRPRPRRRHLGPYCWLWISGGSSAVLSPDSSIQPGLWFFDQKWHPGEAGPGVPGPFLGMHVSIQFSYLLWVSLLFSHSLGTLASQGTNKTALTFLLLLSPSLQIQLLKFKCQDLTISLLCCFNNSRFEKGYFTG